MRRATVLSLVAATVVCASAAATILGVSGSSKRGHRTVAKTRVKGLKLVPIEGGPDYFAKKSPKDAWADHHILLGAWLEEPENARQVREDAAMGDNIYWNLAGTPGHSTANFNVIRAGGMHVIAPESNAETGSETLGFQGADEADMDFGPGSDAIEGWSAAINGGLATDASCSPSGSQCGYTVVQYYYTGQPSTLGPLPYKLNGEVINQGFGKGVLFWETNAQAARFLDYSDILSADSYWLTDDDLEEFSEGGCALKPKSLTACDHESGQGLTAAETKLPANYAFNVTRLARLQKLDGPSKPIIADVETGCPFANGASAGNCATPPQSIAAAWHALIAGARGILWFQHNFSGPCQDDRTFLDGSNPRSKLYDCQQTPGVTLHDVVKAISGFNHEVKGLNKVLLSPTLDGYVKAHGDISVMTKPYHGSCYIFAGAGRPGDPPAPGSTIRFSLADSFTGRVKVYDERRTIQATSGSFEDTFADEDSVHIYVISGDPVCEAESA